MPTFAYPDHSFFPPSTLPRQFNATSGTTFSMTASQPNVYFSNATAIATLTVKLPPSPYSGQVATITSKAAITALTVQDSKGVAVTPGPASNGAGVELRFRYLSGAWAWLIPATVAAP